jgi:23S rRNA (cytosine1962-C5)-methyltransferase
MQEVIVKKGRERSLVRRHPWLLSGSIESEPEAGAAEPGAWVRVRGSEGEVLGHGHYSPASSIRVRLLAFGKEALAPDLIARRIEAAVERRGTDPRFEQTDALRLVNEEGDFLPGLVVDRLGDVVVVKLMSAGMAARREEIVDLLRRVTGAPHGYERVDGQAARREGIPARQGVLWGEAPPTEVPVREGRRRYLVNPVEGQKSGFYLDHRESRDLVEEIARDRRVLDLFSYTGGFAVAAAVGGASHVTLVDSSAPALELARRNLALDAKTCPAEFIHQDAFEFLRSSGPGSEAERYDVLVLDPPPLVRHKGELAKASRAFKDLFRHALRHAAPEASILVFAASHHMDGEHLRKILFGASLDAGRPVQILRSLGASGDHPISLDHPEGETLTGFWLRAP